MLSTGGEILLAKKVQRLEMKRHNAGRPFSDDAQWFQIDAAQIPALALNLVVTNARVQTTVVGVDNTYDGALCTSDL